MSIETASSLLDPSLLRLRESLEACAQPLDDGSESHKAVSKVVEILNSISHVPQSENDVSQYEDENSVPDYSISEEALHEVYQCLSNSPSKQMVIDVLSMDLPQVVCRMGTLSDKCQKIAKIIIELFVSTCNPRDMIAILCEALDVEIEESKAPLYYLLLFNGLAQVLLLIQRRHLEQVKVTIPVVLNVLSKVSVLNLEEEHNKSITELFESAVRIGGSIQEMCKNMDGRRKKELCAILGLYILHNIALISQSRQKISSCTSIVLHMSKFLPFCGFSYFGLITGSDVTTAIKDDDDLVRCFSLSKDGASLSVIWGHINGVIANSIGEKLELVVKEIQRSWIEMWKAVGMLKYPLSSVTCAWEIKEHALELLSNIMERDSLDEPKDQNFDFSSFVPSIFTTLQAIQMVMMGAMDASLRKKAFVVLKKIISTIPSSDRFDILKALITNSTSPTMKALLIDMVREQVAGQYQKDAKNNENVNDQHVTEAFSWSFSALDLVEVILRPPEGGPPPFPDNSEPVLSALNLLRFLLIKESTGQSNGIKVLTQQTLQKIYLEWLLPLRMLVTSIRTDNEDGGNEFTDHLMCGLNPVLLVLYRCIELVEQSMKHL
ncbi:aberrant root formation protein isoform X2 [Carex rostrata]